MRKLYALLLAAGLVLLFAPAARAADNGSWSVFPATSGTAQRPYFYLFADPGATLADQVSVANKTSAPLTFRLYGADAYNTERDGGFAVRSEAGEADRGGCLGETGPEQDHRPRELLASPSRSPSPCRRTPSPGTTWAPWSRLTTGWRRARPPPARSPSASSRPWAPGSICASAARPSPRWPSRTSRSPSTARWSRRTGESRTDITYTLHNRGNVTLNPKVDLKATGLFGRTLLSRDLTRIPAELLPGQKVELTEAWHGSPQLDWGDVKLTASAKDAHGSAAASFFALPWLAAAVLLAAALALAAHRVVRRRIVARS